MINGHRQAYVSIVPFNRPFNYSIACNLGAAAAHGEYLLFLNNDIEVIHPDWLEELVRWGQLPGIGVSGAKLDLPGRDDPACGEIPAHGHGIALRRRA